MPKTREESFRSAISSVVGDDTLIQRNVTVAGHRMGMRLELETWDALYDVCRRERVSIHALFTEINDRKAPSFTLDAAVRVFLMAYYQAAAQMPSEQRALASLADLTPEEVAAIEAGIRQDPDSPELSDADFAAMVPESRRSRSRQQRPARDFGSPRPDRGANERFKVTVPGWHARLDEPLRRVSER